MNRLKKILIIVIIVILMVFVCSEVFKTVKVEDGKKTVDSWRDDIIYFVMIDRFSDGDKTNNMDVDLEKTNYYHGGDLQGLINNLDYIKDIGVTAICITPPMKNQKEFFGTQGYHGYWPIDFFLTDEHFGSMEKFIEFVNKSHEKGMKVILDMPLNHTAWDHPFHKDPEKKESWYHHFGDIKNYEDPYQSEYGSMWRLPDLAQENPDVADYLIDVSKFWIDKGVDGFRLDAVKHIPLSFWKKFVKEMHAYAGDDFFMVGECFDSNLEKINKYQQVSIDSLFDVPLYFAMIDTFAKDGSMRHLSNRLIECADKYDHPEMMSVFLDNPDKNRFLTDAGGDKDKLKLALAFSMTINRIPFHTYGTEVSMEGGYDRLGEKYNRADMEFGKDPDMLDYFKKLTSIRQENPSLRRGDMNEMYVDDNVFAFSRKCNEQEVVVILNNARNNEYREIPIRPESGIKEGTALKDLITGQTITVNDGKICVNIGRKTAGIFVPQK